MIEIEYVNVVGNNLSIGNRMFQYAFGRILAEQKGWSLVSSPIPNFPETEKAITGQAYSEPTLELRGHIVDVKQLMAVGPARILLTNEAYLQRYSYYKHHKKSIRKWFSPLSTVNVSRGDDLVIHLRLGDYQKLGWAVPYAHLNSIIELIDYNNIWIVTDDPKNVQMGQIRRANCVKGLIHHEDWLSDMKFIACFDKILVTGSTFAWWAAWLSGAREIHFPLFDNGCWSFKRSDVDLFVDDESRYKYYPEGLSQALSYEGLIRERGRLGRKLSYAIMRLRRKFVTVVEG